MCYLLGDSSGVHREVSSLNHLSPYLRHCDSMITHTSILWVKCSPSQEQSQLPEVSSSTASTVRVPSSVTRDRGGLLLQLVTPLQPSLHISSISCPMSILETITTGTWLGVISERGQLGSFSGCMYAQLETSTAQYILLCVPFS